MRTPSKATALLSLCAALGTAAGACHAGVMRYCEPPAALSAGAKDKLLRFGAVVKAELENSGAGLALIARSGLDLGRFGYRYSHAGFSLKASPDTPWAVRQLYFACDQQRPRLYDQGMSAFLLGTHEPALGYVSMLVFPAPQATQLERTALDNRQALQLLGSTYSANAYPFSRQYQNCNQWVIELLATAFRQRPDDADVEPAEPRAQAQDWLRDQGYVPSVFDVGAPLMWLGAWVPWVHDEDHPPVDLAQRIYRVSMPASIEAFVHALLPEAERIEVCHTDTRIVVRHGWEPIAEGCVPGAQDRVVLLD